MVNKFFTYFEALPQELKDKFQGKGLVKNKEAIFHSGYKYSGALAKKKLEKVQKRAKREGEKGLTGKALAQAEKNERNIGVLGSGSSRYVFKSTSAKNVIKMASKRTGLLQNQTELNILKELGTVIGNDLAKRKKFNNLFPTIIDYDKDSIYGKRGIPLWIEFKKLKPADGEAFARKYNLIFEEYDYLDYYYPTYFPFDYIWDKKGGTERIVSVPTLQARLKTYAEKKSKIYERDLSILDFKIQEHETFMKLLSNSKTKEEKELNLKRIQKNYQGLELSSDTPNMWRERKANELTPKQIEAQFKKLRDKIIIYKKNCQTLWLNAIKPQLKTLMKDLDELARSGLLLSDLGTSHNWGMDGSQFKILDLGFSKKVREYYEK